MLIQMADSLFRVIEEGLSDWIDLEGTAQIQKNNKIFSLSINESTCIDKNE